jgi:hypothetical protein
LRQSVAFGLGQIRPLAFAEHRQQKYRKVPSAAERDHPKAAALAFAAPGEPNLARATRTPDHVARVRTPRDMIDDAVDLTAAQAAAFAAATKEAVSTTACTPPLYANGGL